MYQSANPLILHVVAIAVIAGSCIMVPGEGNEHPLAAHRFSLFCPLLGHCRSAIVRNDRIARCLILYHTRRQLLGDPVGAFSLPDKKSRILSVKVCAGTSGTIASGGGSGHVAATVTGWPVAHAVEKSVALSSKARNFLLVGFLLFICLSPELFLCGDPLLHGLLGGLGDGGPFGVPFRLYFGLAVVQAAFVSAETCDHEDHGGDGDTVTEWQHCLVPPCTGGILRGGAQPTPEALFRPPWSI
jgi:hypothetical protein